VADLNYIQPNDSYLWYWVEELIPDDIIPDGRHPLDTEENPEDYYRDDYDDPERPWEDEEDY